MVPVGVNREISGTQTTLRSEYNAGVCVSWGILPVRWPLGPYGVTRQQGPVQAGRLSGP